MLATSVTKGHKFPFHGYVAPRTDIIAISIWKNHHFSNRHLQTVAEKNYQKVPEECWPETCFILRKFHGCSCPPVISALGWTAWKGAQGTLWSADISQDFLSKRALGRGWSRFQAMAKAVRIFRSTVFRFCAVVSDKVKHHLATRRRYSSYCIQKVTGWG